MRSRRIVSKSGMGLPGVKEVWRLVQFKDTEKVSIGLSFPIFKKLNFKISKQLRGSGIQS